MSGSCADLTGTATALKQAGAAAMVAYAGPGQQCAGTLTPGVGLPVLQARPQDPAALLKGAGQRAELVTHDSPGYMYDLVKFWGDSVPDGGTVDGTGNAQPPADLEAIKVRQHHVEHNHAVRRSLGHPQGVAAQPGDGSSPAGCRPLATSPH